MFTPVLALRRESMNNKLSEYDMYQKHIGE